MDTSSAREYPKKCLKTEIFSKYLIDHFSSTSHVRPALAAYLSALTARPHIVIVSHINIKHHLLLHWNEHLFLCAKVILWRYIKHRAYIYLVRAPRYQCVVKLLGRLEAQVPAVDVVLEREGELPVVKLL